MTDTTASTSGTPLSKLADRPTVNNVLIFVSDAMRYDFLPDEVRKLGVTAKAISASTFTASSIPSLTTGLYPATHGVWMFDDRLPKRPPLLDDDAYDVGFDTETVWIELDAPDKPPLQINHVDTERTIEDLEPPFVNFVHDVGPHAPYGFENGVFDSTKEFFRTHEKRRPQLVSLYRQDCHNSAQRFLRLYERLSEDGLLDETLVVFTSDHGQCLGEWINGGRFGHGHPMSPENVEVPIVFAGAGLPKGETYDPLLSGVDVAPTVISAQRGEPPADVDGVDLWRSTPQPTRKVRSDVWQHLDVDVAGRAVELSVYAATSAWNRSGGYVFHRKSSVQRLGAIGYDNVFRGYSPAWLGNLSPTKALNMLSIALTSSMTYGAPDFSRDEAQRVIPSHLEQATHEASDAGLSDEQKTQLRDLGYLQ
ncbi:sulfatase-like hydrolase/transferase [Haloferax chudinovii]|uniref:Sulfatase-like hydrolase/transferase n=1 Tax=Haloferax chudinovii TaxID=1109010 RepID=A0ABD5XGK7_9EURY